jgi:4-hydroxybenzoate polyprenyltransferase
MASASHSSSGVVRPALFARLVKVEHSVYALPFAYAGAVLAEQRIPSWPTLVWITVAMVAARSAAMALNRLIDAGIDARNPRTAGRELPTGSLSRAEVVAFTVASLGVLVLATFFLSPPCRYLWPIVVAAFIAYPYTKRYTWFCHYALGLTDGLAPAAAWVAVSGHIALSPVLLFVAVGLWVGGFDVIYAIFDLDFDRQEGIHSLPVKIGWRRSLLVAALSHLAAVGLLVAVGPLLGLGWIYVAGCLLVAALLAWSHVDIARRGLQRVGMGFMTVNGVVGLVYGVVAIVAVLLS